jgi:hypothetical protein
MPVRVYYNAFVSPDNVQRSLDIIHEQLASWPGKSHDIVYVSVGKDVELPGLHKIKHLNQGDELDTLTELWRHCRANPEDRVAYIHSKGTFHDSRENDHLRRLLTNYTFYCTDALGANCRSCGARMTPLPRPQFPGNMWAAQCSYVRKLSEPFRFRVQMDTLYDGTQPTELQKLASSVLKIFNYGLLQNERFCLGRERYASEAWILSHPESDPCDLSPSRAYKAGHSVPEVPDGPKILRPAPRFQLSSYDRTDNCAHAGLDLEERLREYQFLYNITPGDGWWGWRVWPKPV